MKNIAQPSRRAIANLQSGAFIELEEEADKLPQYDKIKCPDGLLNLAGAVNTLVDDLMSQHVDDFSKVYPLSQGSNCLPSCAYPALNNGLELSENVAQFINHQFKPAERVAAQSILVTNGVSSLIDLMAFNMCDHGEGVMVITPTYMMFSHDLCSRAGVSLVPVHPTSMEKQFSGSYATQLARDLEKAYAGAKNRGIRCRALVLCNPCNPMGRSYSRESLIAVATFCGKRGMHLLSDEIYGMSSFASDDPDIDTFTSVLTLQNDPNNSVYKENIHCMYGASKDFGAGGLRLGFLITRNKLLWSTCRRLALFSWVATFSGAFFTHLLSKQAELDYFFKMYQARLKDSYLAASELLQQHGVPFYPANSGVFLFVNLSKWLIHFDSLDETESAEAKLCRYLMHSGGVFLSMGELSLSPVPGCFRLVYTGEPSEVALAISRIGSALSQLDSFGLASSASSIVSDTGKQKETLSTLKQNKDSRGGSLMRFLNCVGK
ncbi:pyridoxal phosphate-dependent transferase [Xylariales sp. PMI_506]|nr:pyridoxal phosphate-dependent transferase [Xylariales sp. PMI_506]